MTSSLVGSEMCIRDRHKLGPLMACAADVGWPGDRLRLLRVVLGASEPVSYTHLTLPTICSV
eukprot:4596055-Prorocentrum_lima.AAC.1